MRIIFCGTQCNGKTTLLENFKHNWPMYKTPEKSYREAIKEQGLSINREGNVASQRVIRDALLDQLIAMSGEKDVVYDRSVIDNIVYTLHGVDKKRISDADFVAESILLCKESMKMVDIIFWLPLNPNIEIVEGENRDVDQVYREEIDFLFQGVFDSYTENTGILFDPEDQPAMIMLTGDVQEKIDMIAQYIGDDGALVETEQSILSTMEDEFEKLQILNRLKQ